MFLISVRDDSDICDVLDCYDVRKAYGVLDCAERYAVLSMIRIHDGNDVCNVCSANNAHEYCESRDVLDEFNDYDDCWVS